MRMGHLYSASIEAECLSREVDELLSVHAQDQGSRQSL